MSFREAIINCYKNFLCFDGRARRSEFWYFQLFVFIVGLLIATLIYFEPSLSFLTFVFDLFFVFPGILASMRRLHDIGKSGAFWLLNLIPLVGSLVLIFWYCRDSESEENPYGINPKELKCM